MISVTALRTGTVFEENGEPYLVLKYEHTKMGRGTANIKVRVRDLSKRTVTEKTFISGARVQEASVTKRKLQFLYRDGDDFCFMDPKTFEQFSVPLDIVADQGQFLKEGSQVDISFWSENPINLELPPKMEFTIAETGPGVKGNSATNIFKSATLDNGMTIKVPLFINAGEKILVDTRTGDYVSRLK